MSTAVAQRVRTGPLTDLLDRVPAPPPHPHADALHAEISHWATELGVLTPHAIELFFAQGHLDLASRCWGDVPAGPRLRAAAKWLLLGWILDDHLDRHWLGDTSGNARRTVRELASVVGRDGRTIATTPLACAFAGLWYDSAVLTGPDWQTRQAADFRAYLDSSLSFLNQDRATPTVPQYLSHRERDGAIRCAAGWIELAHGLDLPEPLFRDPQLADLRARFGHFTGWVNDLCSREAEAAVGHGNNLLRAIEVHEGLPSWAATEKVAALCAAELTTLEFLAEGIAKGSHWPPQVRRYARALVRFAHALAHWTASSGRYL